ncbi:transcriptional regulator [Thermococcus profundus]|uniref:HTH-type transcriptional regulator n=1 Tax=Thermococcus profundus TaxID=49899 RepID=A0A2Z2MK79_THEPR|nr:helix-turn-helix domain-containing protein [Thermococcus profundus]ASJ02358.1 transcriptional regulator [Thermococcus profundus]
MSVKAKDKTKFVEIIERMLTRWGYGSTEARVYAVLLFHGKPMTISTLAEETGLSRSSISIALSKLTREYLVACRRRGRIKYFTAMPIFLEKFLKIPKDTLEREIKPLKEIVEKLVNEADEDRKRQFEGIKKELDVLECILRKIIELEEKESECISSSRPSQD